jgi:hypothetical protein
VRTTDAYGCQGTQVINLQICPVITITPASPAAGSVGTLYSQTLTATGGTGPYTWTTVTGTFPAGLSLSGGGIVSGLPTAEISSVVTVRATDANGCATTRPLTFAMGCPPITINQSTLPSGSINVAYSQTLTASGGTAPYGDWTVSVGTLPTGLILNPSTGVISGTPTASNGAGTTFTVSVKDNYDCVGVRTFTLIICPVINIHPAPLSDGVVGGPYSQTVSASGGAAAYVLAHTAGILPVGLTFNAATGVISGTPTSTTAATFTIRATDANGCIGTRIYTVTPALPTIDFGDFSAFASASSTMSAVLRMGLTVDAEAVDKSNASATGDDLDVSDDEDGVTLPASMPQASSVTIPVSVFNNTGGNAFLHSWIDFNNDGILNDALVSSGGERLEAARTDCLGSGGDDAKRDLYGACGGKHRFGTWGALSFDESSGHHADGRLRQWRSGRLHGDDCTAKHGLR